MTIQFDAMNTNLQTVQRHSTANDIKFSSFSFVRFYVYITVNSNETTQIAWLGNHPFSFFL